MAWNRMARSHTTAAAVLLAAALLVTVAGGAAALPDEPSPVNNPTPDTTDAMRSPWPCSHQGSHDPTVDEDGVGYGGSQDHYCSLN